MVCMEDTDWSAVSYLTTSGRETKKCHGARKLRMLTFKIKALPYCRNQHVTKGATFTLEVNSIVCVALFSTAQQAASVCRQVGISHAN